MNTNTKLLCAAGFGAAVQLAMAYELSAVATRDKNAGHPDSEGERPRAGGFPRQRHLPAHVKRVARPQAVATS